MESKRLPLRASGGQGLLPLDPVTLSLGVLWRGLYPDAPWRHKSRFAAGAQRHDLRAKTLRHKRERSLFRRPGLDPGPHCLSGLRPGLRRPRKEQWGPGSSPGRRWIYGGAYAAWSFASRAGQGITRPPQSGFEVNRRQVRIRPNQNTPSPKSNGIQGQ